MSDVQPRLKEKVECPCECGTFGTPKKKIARDGLRHVARCPCKRCRAPRFKQNATRRESRIAKDTGGSREPLSGALSGVDGRSGLHVWEETSARDVVRTAEKWWLSKGVQDKVARLMKQRGVARHLILSWGPRLKPQIVITPYDDWASMVKPADEDDA